MYKVRFGYHNLQGIHGACPMDMLHATLIGMFKCTRDCFFQQIGPDSKLADAVRLIAKETNCPGFASRPHRFHKDLLTSAKLQNVTYKDITEDVKPMFDYFRRLSALPQRIIRLFGKEARFVNSTIGYYGKPLVDQGYWRYVIASGVAPKQKGT